MTTAIDRLLQPLVDRVADIAAQLRGMPRTEWGTVASVAPLTVLLDGDDIPIQGAPSVLVGQLAAGQRVQCVIQGLRVTIIGKTGGQTPAGVIVSYAGATAPPGWLLCDGRSLARADYPALFAAIGTQYGAPDGSTFLIPDLRGRVAVGQNPADVEFNTLGKRFGAKTHTLTTAQMPSHRHDPPSGSKYIGIDGSAGTAYAAVGAGSQLRWNWTQQDVGGGEAHNNIQPSIALNALIST